MGEVKLYSKDKFEEDIRYYDIPAYGWFCRIAGRTCRIFTNRGDVNRYRNGLQRAAGREMAEVQFFVCRKGVVYTILNDTDRSGLQRIIRSANAGYGKYRRYMEERADFTKWEPVPIQTSLQRSEIVDKIFNILYVADDTVSDV